MQFVGYLNMYLREKKKILRDQNFQFKNSKLKHVPALNPLFQYVGTWSEITRDWSESETRCTYFWENSKLKLVKLTQTTYHFMHCNHPDSICMSVWWNNEDEFLEWSFKIWSNLAVLTADELETDWKVTTVLLWLPSAIPPCKDAEASSASIGEAREEEKN